MQSVSEKITVLIGALSGSGFIRAIGKTGGNALPNDGYSDIDLFLFCDAIPALPERESILRSLPNAIEIVELGTREHPYWGLVDSVLIGEQEVYLMYFSVDSFQKSVDSILRGERTEREENYFYPTGRLSSILGMHAFYDPNRFLADLKARIAVYPDALRSAILSRCMPKIDDEEDFMRAIRRQDVLFYHATLDLALDRFLQSLFALNRVYFPSRKRSLEFIQAFSVKPNDCEARLMQVVSFGANAEALAESYALWRVLCGELENLISA